jgi:Zn-dependent protease with chaperone function
MKMQRMGRAPTALLACAFMLLAPSARAAADRPTPGFNLFSIEQDIEIGRQSAVEAEQQLLMLGDRNVDGYLGRIIARLAAQAPGGPYPYTIKAVNAPEINAFALPGGPMYVNRGLFEAARSESELAGVLAHEMSHVALRHGTHQVSKAYLGQAGLGILGGLLGKNGENASQIVNAVGGLGLNVAFLKFGRDDEYQADRLGAEIMAGAGYNPVAMADFFGLLRSEQGRDPGKLERFLSDHPPSADRESRIRDQAGSLTLASSRDVGGFDRMRAALQKGAPAPGSAQPAEVGRDPQTGLFEVRVAQPSSRFQNFEQRNGFFSIDYPDNWQTYAASSGFAVSMAPAGGVVDTGDGRQAMLYGVIVNHYAPFEGDTARRQGSQRQSYAPFEDTQQWSGSLADATDDLVRTLIRSNSYLRAQEGGARREEIDGEPSFSVALSGRSPETGQTERVTLVTRAMPDGHVIYALCIVPGTGYGSTADTFSRMLRTLRVDDAALHRTQTSSFRR